MSQYIQHSEQETEKYAINCYSHSFNPVFYTLGIVEELNKVVLEYFGIKFEISSDELESLIDSHGVSIDIVFQSISNIYKDAQTTTSVNVKTCFYIRRVYNYLFDLKNNKDVSILHSHELTFIVEMLIHSVHHEILIRAPEWFNQHSQKNLEYWPRMFNVKPDTFQYFRGSNDRIITGRFTPKKKAGEPATEFYVQPINQRTDFIKFTHGVDTNVVKIWWQLADLREWFTGKVCDNIFYSKGGALSQIFYKARQRVRVIDGKEKVIADPRSREQVKLSDFIKILAEHSSPYSHGLYTNKIITPWGWVAFNINNINVSDESPPSFDGILI